MNQEQQNTILAYALVSVGFFSIPAAYALLCYAMGV